MEGCRNESRRGLTLVTRSLESKAQRVEKDGVLVVCTKWKLWGWGITFTDNSSP